MSFGQKNHFVFINKKHPSFEKPQNHAFFERRMPLLHILSSARQNHSKDTTLSQFAVYRKCSSVGFYKVPGNGQTQSGSLHFRTRHTEIMLENTFW